MTSKAGKRPLRSLTAHEKLDAIRRVHDGESKASVARDIGVPESTLRGWCKNEDKISYLSRQSSPETDDSVHGIEPKEKKIKLEENLPFNLSLKPQRPSYSPNTETKYNIDYIKAENDTPKCDKFALNLNTKPETPKSTCHLNERDRNRAELARLSVELGLNRPEMFMSNVNPSNALADISTNIGLLAQWNSLLLQQQQKSVPKKVTAPADTSTSPMTSSSLLTTAYTKLEPKTPKLPKVEPPKSVEDSVWYWLKTQQAMLGLSQNQTSPVPSSTSPQNGTLTNISTTTVPTNLTPNDQNSSWFWKWYKQFAHTQQTPEKPILYQQLTKDKDVVSNSENIQAEEKPRGNTKARAVLDNLLLNNNNNVASNKTDIDDEDLNQTEALEHGEKFLKWLECCSEPSVTAMQIMQFKSLLNNIKSGADRKNGDHNKTKVKRK